ncbi:ABC transporter [Mesorhizobium tianshanense]|uniref:Glycine betaine/proline transport system substrate-binding protein n=1 Tax=Mesorhizobium tianshanense TaxID=39844 RepID=A0A562NM76_9HYPH|nr:ABC transporter substrate-binding protein [Mesorhizobium tianshanense]TWI33170.1 glycine betaine/proline transport system substrate-binding protein [Mesorhizobium tianshanense]GLS34958.1 ABC transporter [Mesorhizobium tianshanense]
MTNMRTIFRFLTESTTAVSVALLLLSSPSDAIEPESTEPIKISLNDWSSQNISSYILGGVLEKQGYVVEYVQADAMAQFAGLETGDITMQTEIWPTTQGDRFAASMATGNLIDMGPLGLKAREEWWYPLYMKEKCPGLPDWHALLNEDCAKAFSTPQTASKGRYLGGPVTWEGFDEERIHALKLPWTVIHAGTDANLWAELDSAYKRKSPIMLWVYSPHWWPTKFQGEWVEFPPYTAECYEAKRYDCGKPYGDIHKAAWAGGEATWPHAYSILRKVAFDVTTYADLIKSADLDGKQAKDVADQWIMDNTTVWNEWVK